MHKIHIEKGHNILTSYNIIWMTQSRKIGWIGYIAYIKQKRNLNKSLVVKPGGDKALGR
jgi:hypothetical protein